MSDPCSESNPCNLPIPSAGVPRDAIDYLVDYVVVFGTAALVTVGLVLGIAIFVSRYARNRSIRWQIWVTALAAPSVFVIAGCGVSIIGHDGTLDGVRLALDAPWYVLALFPYVYGVAWLAARFFVQRFARTQGLRTGEVFQ